MHCMQCLLHSNGRGKGTTAGKHHIARKNEAMAEKAVDKDKAKAEESYHAVIFDLQAVLTTPFAGDAQIYYKRKLSVYNFTIYINSSASVTCGMKRKGQGCK